MMDALRAESGYTATKATATRNPQTIQANASEASIATSLERRTKSRGAVASEGIDAIPPHGSRQGLARATAIDSAVNVELYDLPGISWAISLLFSQRKRAMLPVGNQNGGQRHETEGRCAAGHAGADGPQDA